MARLTAACFILALLLAVAAGCGPPAESTSTGASKPNNSGSTPVTSSEPKPDYR